MDQFLAPDRVQRKTAIQGLYLWDLGSSCHGGLPLGKVSHALAFGQELILPEFERGFSKWSLFDHGCGKVFPSSLASLLALSVLQSVKPCVKPKCKEVVLFGLTAEQAYMMLKPLAFLADAPMSKEDHMGLSQANSVIKCEEHTVGHPLL